MFLGVMDLDCGNGFRLWEWIWIVGIDLDSGNRTVVVRYRLSENSAKLVSFGIRGPGHMTVM